jgi:hypothetical protein
MRKYFTMKPLAILLLVLSCGIVGGLAGYMASVYPDSEARTRGGTMHMGIPMTSVPYLRLDNNQWLQWGAYAGGGTVNGFKVATTDLLEVGTTIQLDDFEQGNMAIFHQVTSLGDDSEYALETGVSGTGWAQFGDNDDYCPFIFTSAGVVTLLTDATANCANTDTDAKAVVYDCGSGPCVKNRLAATKTVGISVRYFTP